MNFGDLLIVGASWALALGGVWALLICLAAVVEVASDGRLALTSRLGCPAPARRALLTGLGVLLASGGAVVAGPVSAAPAPYDASRPGSREQPSGLTDGLPLPARPLGGAPTGAPRTSIPRQQVVVEPGDSLWRLAREHAQRRASTTDVARLVERTYRANRRVIGPDPDLIRPGQRLHLPQQRRATDPPSLEETP